MLAARHSTTAVAARALRAPLRAGAARGFSASCVLRRPVYYSKSHEWANVEDGKATIGITDHAQDELGEVVYVDLPDVGDSFAADETYGTVESVKATSELIMPVSGKVSEKNEELEGNTGLVNESPEEKAWMIKVEGVEVPTEGLMDKDTYLKWVAEQKAE